MLTKESVRQILLVCSLTLYKNKKAPKCCYDNILGALFLFQKMRTFYCYVNFKNNATGQDVNAEILSEFAKAGFRNEPNIKNADFIILGDVQSFSRTTKRDPRFSMGMGYGFGRPSFGFGYSMFFPFDYDDYDDDFSTNSYAYYMQVSVLVRPKDGGEKATNISLMQAGNVYSPSYIWPFFKERLAKQIVSFFYNVSQR